MPSLFDMDYGTVRKGTGRLSGREAPRATPSLWDYINAVSMTPVPGVSDVAAGLLAAKDFREGNYGSGALNAAGLIPFVPALGGIFKGVKGATKAEKKALLKAQQMAREGADRDTIWNATLWYQGKDGKWRTEISDEAAKFTGMPTVRNAQGYLEISKSPTDFLQHDELFSAYPELKNLNIKPYPITGEKGSYDEARKLIEINVPNEQQGKSILMHEFQHPIQQYEGMARGGSPEMFSGAKDMVDLLAKESDNMPSVLEFWKRRQSGSSVKDAAQGLPREAVAEAMGFNNIDEALLRAEQVKQEISRWADIAIDPYTAYRSLLGEVDARNTQARMDMTLDQRRQFPPWSTWDVPEADQIVRMEGGPEMLRGLLGR